MRPAAAFHPPQRWPGELPLDYKMRCMRAEMEWRKDEAYLRTQRFMRQAVWTAVVVSCIGALALVAALSLVLAR